MSTSRLRNTVMAASDDLDRFYKCLGVSSKSSQDEIKKAFLKQCLKWHPEKNKQRNAKKKFEEITEAYEALIAPTVHRVQEGKITLVSLSRYQCDTADGSVAGLFSKFNFISWFRPSSVQESINTRVDDAIELLSEYMYDGDLGEFFSDADNTLHVIVSIPLGRALIGGKVSFKIPTTSGSEITHTEDVSGILDGYWRPMKRITAENRQIWIIFKVVFPKDMSEEEQIELRQKLLFAQTSAAIIPTIWNWLMAHPKTSACGAISLVIGGVTLLRRSSLFRIARMWVV